MTPRWTRGLVFAGALVVGSAAAVMIFTRPRASDGAEALSTLQRPSDLALAERIGSRLREISEKGPQGEPVAPEPPEPDDPPAAKTLVEQREQLLATMTRRLRLAPAAIDEVRTILSRSKVAGQGKPDVTEHPMTRAECRAARETAGLTGDRGHPRCPVPFMVPVYDPDAGGTPETASVCIDQYEFPSIPCEYPLVAVTAREAAELCQAVGKRLCDAHEWEGACAGAVRSAEDEYPFGKERVAMTHAYNEKREIRWAYGATKDHTKCGTGSRKSPKCTASGFSQCGSNTYPAGSFPECKSPFGVFDQHGNAAEHMNLPTRETELSSRGGMGHTEMKGSWFIFQSYEAHPDDCRWRARDWHPSRVMDRNSHANYHLGFRCCADVAR